MTDSMPETSKCRLCGEPMPPGEEMFYYHGYSGDCPKPPLPKVDAACDPARLITRLQEILTIKIPTDSERPFYMGMFGRGRAYTFNGPTYELLSECADQLTLLSASLREQCVIGIYCRKHGFIHGAEAEELRKRVETILDQVDHEGDDAGEALDRALRVMLDDVDARDSVAYLEIARPNDADRPTEEAAHAVSPQSDDFPTCEHGTAMDVHCCNCHSGFLFDTASCVCKLQGEDEMKSVFSVSGESAMIPFSGFELGILFNGVPDTVVIEVTQTGGEGDADPNYKPIAARMLLKASQAQVIGQALLSAASELQK